MAEHYGNEAPNDRLAEQSSPPADPSPDQENQPEVSTARDMADEFDTLVALLRQPARPDSFSQEPACQRAVEAIRQMGRTPNPSELDPAVSADGQMPALRALGQYQLLEKLGEGGMGAVYRALHTRLEKVVAVKVMSAGRVDDPEAIARFDREMRAVGRLNHPNIVGAFDAGESDGSHYLVMELVDGQDLGAIVRRTGPLPVADACEAIRQAAVGLDHAHAHGLVHRDVKPSNLMLTRQGEVKVLDLGLARLAEQVPGGVELTSTGQMMGTFDYMAPEQGSDSHAVDHRADVYALGATLYRLLAGRAPFAGPQYDTPMKRMMALATEDPEPIRQIRPDVPKDLARVIHRMLARDPGRRPATGREAADLLAPFGPGSDLAGLVARADEAAPKPSVEPGTASTQPAAASAMEHTPHTIQISPPAAFRPRAGRLSRLAAWFGKLPPVGRFGLAAAAGAAALVLLAVLLTVKTPQGTLVIESDDPNIEVLVKQNGEVIDIVSAEQGWKVGLKDGRYDVALSGGADRMQLSEDQVTLARGGRVVLRVIKKAQDGVSVSAVPLIAPSVAPYVDGDWVRLINRMSDLCIGVNGASTEPRASLHQYDPVPGALEQHWRIESTDRPGMYRLKNRKSGLYVTLKQPRQGEGYLQRPLEDDNNEFLFSILDIDGKWFRIVSQESKLDAAIWGASMREGEWIIQWPFSVGATDKYWRVEPVDEGREHGWVDVLAEMDPQQHSVFGTWRRDGSRLVCNPLDFTRIGSPVFATGDYELEVQFRWIGKVGEVNLLLPAGDSAVHVWVKPGSGGLGQFSGARPAPPAKTWTYEADRRYTLAATVRVDGATATIETRMDGEPYAKWSGPVESLYPRSDWMIPNRTVGFGAHVCNVSLEGLRVRPLEGGQLLRKTYRVEPVEIEPGQTIELAALVDPVRHAVLGKWEVADGEIMCVAPREFARVAIPLVPRGDYELSGTLLRPKGLSPATLAIPVGRSYTGLEIKDKAVLLERVGASPPWKRADVQIGPETQFAVRVEHQGDIAKIHVAIDGKPALDWEGPTVAAQPRFDWVFNPPSLGVGTHSGALAVKDLKFKLLSGTAERIVEEVEPIADSQSAGDAHLDTLPADPAVFITFEPEAVFARDGKELLRDRSGNELHAELFGFHEPANTPAGKRIAFDGRGYAMIPDDPRLCGGSHATLTVAYWFHKETGGAVRKFATPNSKDWSLTATSENLEFYGEKDNSDVIIKAPLAELDSDWNHAAMVLDVRRGQVRFFLNGELVLEQLLPPSASGTTDARVAIAIHQIWPNSFHDPHPCRIDELAIYDRPLSNDEVRRLFTRGADLYRSPTPQKADAHALSAPFPAAGAVEEQKAWVVAELKRLNPECDGSIDIQESRGEITRVELTGLKIGDITPLSHLRSLRALKCREVSVKDLSPLEGLPLESAEFSLCKDITDVAVLEDMPLKIVQLSGSSVTNLSPLTGKSLEGLDLYASPATDFSALRGMPLKGLNVGGAKAFSDCGLLQGMPLAYLRIEGTKVDDLTPLKGVHQLRRLYLGGAPVSDLTPLAELQIEELNVLYTKVTDLSPIQKMPLRSLEADLDVIARNLTLVRGVKTIQRINCRPAAEVLREAEEKLKQTDGHESTEPAQPFPEQGSIEEKKAWVLAELKRLNPEYDGDARFTFAEGDIVGVEVRGREIRDLRPFAPLRKLRVLLCNDSSVSDISPLAGMPLEELRLYGARVSDFGPLKGMPLKTADLCHASVGDLSPLAGMPLRILHLDGTRVADLSPLKGIPLEDFQMANTLISDLSPLAGSPLRWLTCNGTRVKDFSPLKDTPLLSISCDVRPEDAAALRQIRTLKTINDRPAADVLREAEETLKQADVPERPESRSERLENPSGEPPKD